MIKKISALVLSLLTAAAFMTGCSDSDSSSEATSEASGVELTSEITGEPFTGEYIMTVDGYNVPATLYKYFFLSLKDYYDQGDESYWVNNKEQLQNLITDASSYTIRYTVPFLLASSNNVELDAEDNEAIANQINTMIAQYGGEEGYNAALAANNYSDSDTFKYILESEVLDNKIFKYFYGENGTSKVDTQTVLDQYKTDYVVAKHILILKEDESSSSETSETEDSGLILARQVLDKARSGEDFDALISKYNSDPGMQENPDGYLFTYGYMVEEFETAAFALEDGEISDVVETSYGYHIIKKMPLQEYLDKNIEYLLLQYSEPMYTEIVTDKMDNVVCVYSDGYEKIGIHSFN